MGEGGKETSMSVEEEESSCFIEAREALKQCDFLLIAAGAGFSADSGLPVYKDIANVEAYASLGLDYQDLCDPGWIRDDPELGLGFWADCFQKYEAASPHAGYKILQKWQSFLKKKNNDDDPFFIYTSNVDGHFHQYFSSSNIYEIHGSINKWQCPFACSFKKVNPPSSSSFIVNPVTMQLESPVPKCKNCKTKSNYLRPNVLMFRDKNWIKNTDAEARYVEWEAQMEQRVTNYSNKSVVVLEIGCGTNVPSVRLETEMVVKDVRESGGTATLIRVNPEENYDSDNNASMIYLQSTAVVALEKLSRGVFQV